MLTDQETARQNILHMLTNGQMTRQCNGMTKREMMAMNAPNEVPSWFESMWHEQNIGNPEYFCDSLVCEDFDFDTTTTTITQRGLEACYFAWRAYYADKMLAELESKS